MADVRFGAQGRVVVARVEKGRLVIGKTGDVERRLHERFRQIEERSLAEELIRERRAEAGRET